MPKEFNLTCPIPIAQYPVVTLGHGSGGKLMHQLIEKMFLPAFKNDLPGAGHDSAVFPTTREKLAFTSDSFVVKPLFFPGGDIGKLAVCGTVNDLAMCGARPLYLSASFILEEGLAMETLWQIVQSLAKTAEEAGVQVVTGDTKVVDKGKGDGVYINTAGVGAIDHKLVIHPKSIKPGDKILINGDLGRHGMAIMASREGLNFETTIQSDCAPLSGLVLELLKAEVEVHCLRDLTRGGLATTMVEIAQASGREIALEEKAIPVNNQVQAACEMLGLDPLYVANEGRFALFVPEKDEKKALNLMRAHPLGKEAAVVGKVLDAAKGQVTLESKIGVRRILDMLSGDQLPRIC